MTSPDVSAPRGWIVVMVITVVIAFLPTLLTGAFPIEPRGLVLGGAGVLFLLSGLLALRNLSPDRSRVPRARVLAYFVLQLWLAGVIFVSGRFAGSLWICGLPIIAHALLYLRISWATAVIAATVIITAAAIIRVSGSLAALLPASSLLPAYAFVIVFTRIAIRAEEARREAELVSSQLADANGQLREQATRIAGLATLSERNRVAREIHDGLGHYLTTVAVQIEVAKTTIWSDAAQAAGVLEKAHQLAQEALVEVRRSVSMLRSDVAEASLTEKIRALLAATDRAGLEQLFHVQGPPRRLQAEIEHAVFRAIQEGLTNVRKHARARRVVVELDYREANVLTASVEDDGTGSASGAVGGGHGLAGLRERMEQLRGSCTTKSGPHGGFRLQLQIPL
jgi:signal transduction histidine kinase